MWLHALRVQSVKSNQSSKDRVIELRPDDGNYLRMLGERIRDLRLRRGMTRQILCRDSAVSLRYLAQLESGEANISIVRLRQIAEAMGLPLEELVRVGPEQPAELTLLVQYLSRLTPSQLSRAREILLSAPDTLDRRGRIALIGLRGAGKSTLGKMLASHLKVPFIEMADVIEQEAGVTVAEVIALYGQAAFRRYERRSLQRVVETHEQFVLAAGGGIVTEPATFSDLLTACFTIWLKATPTEHMARVTAQGDRRPMSDSQEAMRDLERILAGREPMYRKADVTVNTSGLDLQQGFAELLRSVAV